MLVGLISDFGDNKQQVENMKARATAQLAYYSWLLPFALQRIDEIVDTREPISLTRFLPSTMSHEEATLWFMGGATGVVSRDLVETYRHSRLRDERTDRKSGGVKHKSFFDEEWGEFKPYSFRWQG